MTLWTADPQFPVAFSSVRNTALTDAFEKPSSSNFIGFVLLLQQESFPLVSVAVV